MAARIAERFACPEGRRVPPMERALAALAERGISVRTAELPPGSVFRRDGEGCLRCGTEIRVAEMGNRKVWWCPKCQPR